jgi:hypothetical protein
MHRSIFIDSYTVCSVTVTTCVILGMSCVSSNSVSCESMKVTLVRSTGLNKSKLECESYPTLIAGSGRKRPSGATLKISSSKLELQFLQLPTAQFLPSSKSDTVSVLCLTLAVSIDYRSVVVSISASESASYSEVGVARRVLFVRTRAGGQGRWQRNGRRRIDKELRAVRSGRHPELARASVNRQETAGSSMRRFRREDECHCSGKY